MLFDGTLPGPGATANILLAPHTHTISGCVVAYLPVVVQ